MERILFWTRVDRAFILNSIQSYIQKENLACEIVVVSDKQLHCCRQFAQYYECLPKAGIISDFLKKIIIKYNITGILVASNFDLKEMLDLKDWLLKRQIRFYLPDNTTLSICLSKKLQYYFLRNNGFDVPCSYFPEDNKEEPEKYITFPAICKPNNSQGSVNVCEVYSKDELFSKILQLSDIIVQTKSYGEEYTVDCFNDFSGKLVISSPRKRVLINGAHSIVAQLRFDENIQNIAKKLSNLLHITGPWNFQLFDEGGKYLIHDINPRLSNGIGFCIAAGIPYEKLIVDYLIDTEPEIGFDYYHFRSLDYSYLFSFSSFEMYRPGVLLNKPVRENQNDFLSTCLV